MYNTLEDEFDEQLALAFSVFDVDGDGFISVEVRGSMMCGVCYDRLFSVVAGRLDLSLRL